LAEIFNAASADGLIDSVKDKGINYIYVDDDLRMGGEFMFNEAIIAQAFALVFHDEASHVRIYAV
jgi:hypothetical protein